MAVPATVTGLSGLTVTGLSKYPASSRIARCQIVTHTIDVHDRQHVRFLLLITEGSLVPLACAANINAHSKRLYIYVRVSLHSNAIDSNS